MKRLPRVLLLAFLAGLAACGGGAGGGGGPAPSPTPSPPALAVLSGVAATGQALSAATIRLENAAGETLAQTMATEAGRFTLRIPRDATGPLTLRAAEAGLRAFLPELPSPGGSATVHINPITEAVSRRFSTPPGTLSALSTAGDRLLAEAVGSTAYGLFASDPTFQARSASSRGTPADALLDALTVLSAAEEETLADALGRWAEAGSGPKTGLALPGLLSYGLLQNDLSVAEVPTAFETLGLENRRSDAAVQQAAALLAAEAEPVAITNLAVSGAFFALSGLDEAGTLADLTDARVAPALLGTLTRALEDLTLTAVIDPARDRTLLARTAAAAHRLGRLVAPLPAQALSQDGNRGLLDLALAASSVGGALLTDLLAGPADALPAPLTVDSLEGAQEALQTLLEGTPTVAAQADLDGDGTPFPNDTFPFDPTEQQDSDGDGLGNNTDPDDDNDGIPDTEDERPLTPDAIAPSARFSASTVEALAPALVTFDASASHPGGPLATLESFSWRFGDGSEGLGQLVAHRFDSPGIFPVTLTVKNSAGLSASITQTLTIRAATGTVQISGFVDIASSSNVDSDLNDPDSLVRSNNQLAEAQPIANPTQLGGYLNAPEGGASGPLFVSGDAIDYFRFDAVGGEVIDLNIAEPDELDIDLYLLTLDGQEVDASINLGSREQVIVPEAGAYLLSVEIFDGAGGSNYILQLSTQALGANIASTLWQASDPFVPYELLYQEKPAAKAGYGQRLADLTRGLASQRAGALHRLVLKPQAGARSPLTRRPSESAQDPQRRAARPTRHPGKGAVLRAMKRLQQSGAVTFAEPNLRRRAYVTPNDPAFAVQWHFGNLKLEDAWELTQGSDEVIVAVIDTGVIDHPDLQDRLVGGYDFIAQADNALDGDGIDPDPTDPGDGCGGLFPSSFHGTHVAGTIGASTNNGVGVAGVTWAGRIMPLRVLGCDGGTSFDIVQAVRYAAGLDNVSGTRPPKPAAIINLSLGGPGGSLSEEQTFLEAQAAGSLIIAAAGNEGTSLPSYPAAYDGVISVSATTIDDRLASYSNFGSTIDIAAPGGDNTADLNGDAQPDLVLSTDGDDDGAINPSYEFKAGTSMAAPHVAGVAALMKALLPTLTVETFTQALEAGQLTDDLGEPGRDDRFGYGRLNALKAVRFAQAVASGDTPPAPLVLRASPSTLNFGRVTTEIEVSVTATGDGSEGRITLTSGSPALSVTTLAAEPGSPARFMVRLDRSTLPFGTYATRLDAELGASSRPIVVRFENADPARVLDANAGVVFVLAIDPDTGDSVAQATVLAPVNGRYPFRLTGLTPGRFELVAGTDMDGDFFIGDPGEAFGGYPTLDQLEEISVNGDETGLAFPMVFQFIDAQGASLGTDASARPARQGFRRLRQNNEKQLAP